MLPRRFPCFFAALSVLALASCGSNSALAPGGASVDSEIYDGPVAIAIAPVVDGRSAAYQEVSRLLIQNLIVESLDRANLYAAVIPLELHGEAHEGELLVQPALAALQWTSPNQRSGSITMRIRASHAATGRVRLDQVYTGSCRDCKVLPGQPPIAGPLTVMMQDVIKDLRVRAVR
jgi:hypothetical protein